MNRLSLPSLLVAAAVLGGCATVANPNPADPLESLNRGTQKFNDALDDAILKPVATAYRDVVPAPVRQGVTNFFGNLGDVWSAANHVLQGKPEPALNMTLRVGVNTVFGLAGVLDPATEMGLERQSEDFGQTLGRWGVGPGPYLVLPLLGPSTLRDAFGRPLDMAATSVSVFDVNGGELFAATALDLINGRTNLLGASRMLDEIALDRYSFLRDGYLARRLNLVYDGNPPQPPQERFDDPK
jgi:phospholipid-binding lipoprotein MlaA